MRKSAFFLNACRSTIALAAIGAFSVSAHASTDANAEGNPTITVIGQNTTTAPETVPLNTVYSESTLSSDVVKSLSDDKSLQTMLASQPSVFTFQNGPNGEGANIFFRAFNSGQFAETFGGVALNDVFNGGVTGEAATWNSVLFIPADIDSVVLNRGINNPATNSYNSLGGTIDFLPKQPTDKFGGTLGGGYGSFNSYNLQGSINTGNLGGFKQLLQVDYRQSDGWLANTADKNMNIYYSGRYEAPNGDVLSLTAVYDHNRGSQPFDMPVPLLQTLGKFYQYPTTVDYEQASDNQGMVILDYKAVLSPSVAFENKFFADGQDFLRNAYGQPGYSATPYYIPNAPSTHAYWEYYPSGPSYNPKNEFGSNAAGQAYHFYGYTTWSAGYTPKLTISMPHNTLILGGNLTYGSMHSREYFYGSLPVPQVTGYNDAWDEHNNRLLASVYAQDELKLLNDRLTITPGVKYIYAKTSDTDAIGFYYPYGGTVSDVEHFIAPTVGLNYLATDKLSFNAAFGQNIKLPDIAAYYNAIAGTTGPGLSTTPPIKIKPEHVNDFELGARYKDGEFAASLDFYREDFSDIFIDSFNPNTYSTTVSNGGKARYQGVEVQVSDGVHLEHAGDLKGYVNFAYNEAKYTSNFSADSVGSGLSNSDYNVIAGERMADVPDVLVTVGGTWAYQGFRVDAQGRYIGSQVTLNTDSGAPSGVNIPSYVVMDLGISKTFGVSSSNMVAQSVKLSLNVSNLFDKYYFNEAYVSADHNPGATEFAAPGAPRSVMGKIEISF